MKEIHNSKCPLCDSDATFTLWDSDNIKCFDCPKCTNYFISIRAEKTILKVFNRKEGLAKLAAETRDETQILEITLVQGDLQVQKVPRTKYPR